VASLMGQEQKHAWHIDSLEMIVDRLCMHIVFSVFVQFHKNEMDAVKCCKHQKKKLYCKENLVNGGDIYGRYIDHDRHCLF